MIPLGIVKITGRDVSPINCLEKGRVIGRCGCWTSAVRTGRPPGFITGGTYQNIFIFKKNKQRKSFLNTATLLTINSNTIREESLLPIYLIILTKTFGGCGA